MEERRNASEDYITFKTDIAVIKNDVAQLERLVIKIDKLVDELSGLTQSMAVQSRVTETHDDKIRDVSVRVEGDRTEELLFRKELRDKIDELKAVISVEKELRKKEFESGLEKLGKDIDHQYALQDVRVSKLEQWRWWLMGAGAALGTGLSLLWKSISAL